MPAYAASKDYAYNSETETILANDKADLAEAWEGTECGQSFQYRPLTSFDLFAECVVCCFCLYSSGWDGKCWILGRLWAAACLLINVFQTPFQVFVAVQDTGMSQHMCSIQFLNSFLRSIFVYENQGRCSPFLHLWWSELPDGFTTSDPHYRLIGMKSTHRDGMVERLVILLRWVFPKIGVGPPNHPILIGFSIINHPVWGYSYFWKHPYTLDMKDLWLPDELSSRYQRWIGIQKAKKPGFLPLPF